MATRWTAVRELAGEFRDMTVSMGDLIRRTPRGPDRTTYYEDHF